VLAVEKVTRVSLPTKIEFPQKMLRITKTKEGRLLTADVDYSREHPAAETFS